MHNGRMVQLIIEGSIQSLKLLWTKANKTSESEVLHVLDLFHPLASDIIDEVDHHATHCRESYLEKCHNSLRHGTSSAQPVLCHSEPDDGQGNCSLA